MTITTLNNLSAVWAVLLWKASWQGGAALLLMLVVNRAIRRIPAHVQCWLWRLAFLKLLIAGIAIVSVELPWLPPEKTKSAEMAPITVAEWPAPARDVVTEEIPARLSAMTTPGAISDGGAAASPESVFRLSRSSWLFIAWIVGVVACLVNLMRQWVLVRKMISTLPSGINEGVHIGLVENCRRMGVTGEPDLRVSNDSGSPCLIGVIRPVIVLPSTVLESCSAEALNAALLHELAHIKRRDLLWNWLPALAEVAFFFHPLVWLARREWRLAQEIATDELAVSVSRVDAARYAGWLVELVAKCRATTFRPHLAVGVSETYSQLSRRMTAMLTFQKTTTRRRVVAGVVVLAMAVGGIVPWKLSAREAQAQPESIATQSQTTATAQKSDQPTESQESALAAIEKLGGTIQRDENRPERPVISISFLKNSKVADADLRYLKAFPRLLELTVSHADISDAGLEHLKGLTSLKALFIDKTRVTNEGLAHLKGLSGLVILELGNVRINDEGLIHLQQLTNLDLLHLENTRITDKGLVYLKGMSRLQTLNLDGTRITDAGLEHLARLTSLRDLRLRETGISDAGLVHLRGLTQLDTLVLNSTKVTGEGLVHLDGLPNLRSLWLADSRITDAGLEHLQGLTRLSTLVLRKTHVTDKGLEYVQGLTRLQTLDLGNTKVTDAGLENLNGLTNLRTLNLDSNTTVTDDGVKKLQAALPECKIPWGRSKKRDEHLEVALQAHAPAAQDVPGKTVDELIEEFNSAEYFWQQGDAARKLVALGDKKIIPKLEKHLDTQDRRRRCNAGLVLAGLGDRRGLVIIIGELEDRKPRPTDLKRSDGKPDPEGQISQDRYFAARLLGQLGMKEAVPALIEATTDNSINYQAAISLGKIGDKSAIPALRRMAGDFPDQRLWAGYGLAALGEPEGFDIVMNVALSSPNWNDRRHAVEALGKLGNPKSVPTLIKALRDEHVNVRVSAAIALGNIGETSALPALTEALSDPETTQVNAPTSVAGEAQKAINAIKEKNPRAIPGNSLPARAPDVRNPLPRPGMPEIPPTPETLQKWLEGKEWIELSFGGPHIDPLELRDSLTTKGNLTDFRLTPGEGGRPGKGGEAFVEIGMEVTPENIRQVLALQAELAPRGYVLEGKQARVWSYHGDAKTREQARKLVPEVLASLEQAIKQALPEAECTSEKSKYRDFLGGFKYESPVGNVKGFMHIHAITSPVLGGALAPDQTLHLPHLGLIARQYLLAGRGGSDDASPQRQAIRKVLQEEFEPLLKLELAAGAGSAGK